MFKAGQLRFKQLTESKDENVARNIVGKKNSGTQGLEPATFGSTSKCFPELLWLIEWDFILIYTVQRCI